jgi:hypothetical protein
MKCETKCGDGIVDCLWCGCLAIGLPWTQACMAQTHPASTPSIPPPIILTVEGTNVWVHPHLADDWVSAFPRQILRPRDRGRTGANSRTSVRLSDLSVLRIGWHSEFEIQPLPEPEIDAEFSLIRGLLRLLNRDRPGRHRFVTPTATAATRGTEFVLEVEPGTGRTTLTVFEGMAELSNPFGSVLLAGGEQGIVAPGQAPVKTAVIDAPAIVQWCLYYPGVLDPAELELSTEEEAELRLSLAEYRGGDLLAALSAYPQDRTPVSDPERVYRAALLLATGQVAESGRLLDSLQIADDPDDRVRRLADALRVAVAAVQLREHPSRSDGSRARAPGDRASGRVLSSTIPVPPGRGAGLREALRRAISRVRVRMDARG